MAGVGRDDLTLIDLPGVYSLTPYSEDARVSIDVLKGNMPGTPKPDAVLLVLDSLHIQEIAEPGGEGFVLELADGAHRV